jgi:hypothetical protein
MSLRVLNYVGTHRVGLRKETKNFNPLNLGGKDHLVVLILEGRILMNIINKVQYIVNEYTLVRIVKDQESNRV